MIRSNIKFLLKIGALFLLLGFGALNPRFYNQPMGATSENSDFIADKGTDSNSMLQIFNIKFEGLNFK